MILRLLRFDGEVRKLIHIARQVGGKGSANMLDEVEEHIKGHWEVLTTELLDKLVESPIEKEEGKATEAESAMWTNWNLPRCFKFHNFKYMEYDPQMKKGIMATTHNHQRITIAAATLQWVKELQLQCFPKSFQQKNLQLYLVDPQNHLLRHPTMDTVMAQWSSFWCTVRKSIVA